MPVKQLGHAGPRTNGFFLSQLRRWLAARNGRPSLGSCGQTSLIRYIQELTRNTYSGFGTSRGARHTPRDDMPRAGAKIFGYYEQKLIPLERLVG
jgi:hypothetical protein